jgi:hypothetical protein
MTTYKLSGEGYVIKNIDTRVPIVSTPEYPNTNPDYLEYLAWLADGNTPEPVDQPPLEELKQQKWQEVQSKRDQLEQSGFMFLGHPIDSDPIAVQRISIATLAAQAAHAAGQPFQVDWKCKDDHVLPLDLTGMMGMSAALAMYANGLHTYGRTLKDAIYAAETPEALDAINIEEGWPV